VQLAEPGANADSPISRSEAAPCGNRAVRILGLKMRARSGERAQRQWGEVLGGQLEESPSGELIFQWTESPLRVMVVADPSSPEGAVCIQYESERPLVLPADPHPSLGTSFSRSLRADGGAAGDSTDPS